MTQGMASTKGREILILRLSKYLLDRQYSFDTEEDTIGLAVHELSSERFKLVKRQSKLTRTLLNLNFLPSKMRITPSTCCGGGQVDAVAFENRVGVQQIRFE